MAKRKPGKYEKVTANLPRVVGNAMQHDAAHREKVDAEKRRIVEEETRYASHLAEIVGKLRQMKDDLEDDIKAVNLKLDAYTELLVDQYEAEGIHSMSLQDGGSVRLQYEPYSSVEDAIKLLEWVKENKLEHKLTLHWKTLDGIVKGALSAGEPEPPGVKVFQKIKAVYTK